MGFSSILDDGKLISGGRCAQEMWRGDTNKTIMRIWKEYVYMKGLMCWLLEAWRGDTNKTIMWIWEEYAYMKGLMCWVLEATTILLS